MRRQCYPPWARRSDARAWRCEVVAFLEARWRERVHGAAAGEGGRATSSMPERSALNAMPPHSGCHGDPYMRTPAIVVSASSR